MDFARQKTLKDIITQSRKVEDKTAFFNQVLADVKEEVKSTDFDIKAEALLKLFFLGIKGFDIKWGAFHSMECMSQHKFGLKKVGYLTAPDTLTANEEILLLSTQQLQKDMRSRNNVETSLALNCLGTVMNPMLADFLIEEILGLLTSNCAYLRKKAALVLFKFFEASPEQLNNGFERLVDRLKDSSLGVVTATITTLLHVAQENPNFVLLAISEIYKVFTEIKSNWALIKLIKLMGELMKVEPRLKKKLVEPLFNILNTVSAKSVEYEAVCLILGQFQEYPNLYQMAKDKLRGLIESSDLNLKYLGLGAIRKYMAESPEVVMEYRQSILECLQSKDVSVRIKSLGLIKITTNQDNLEEVVNSLLVEGKAADSSELSQEIIKTIIELCCDNHYELISNFDWLFRVLIELVKMKPEKQDSILTEHIMDVTVRVSDLRDDAVVMCCNLLDLNYNDLVALSRSSVDTQGVTGGISTCLAAILWIIGEYGDKMKLAQMLRVMDWISQKQTLSASGDVQIMAIGCIFKLFLKLSQVLTMKAEISANGVDIPEEEVATRKRQVFFEGRKMVLKVLKSFAMTTELETQSRAAMYENILLAIMKVAEPETDERFQEETNALQGVAGIYQVELKPVHPDAQKLVKIPENLNLETPYEVEETELMDVTRLREITEGITLDDVKKKKKREQPKPKSLKLQKKESVVSESSTEESKSSNSNIDQNVAEAFPALKKTYKVNKDFLLPDGATPFGDSNEESSTKKNQKAGLAQITAPLDDLLGR